MRLLSGRRTPGAFVKSCLLWFCKGISARCFAFKVCVYVYMCVRVCVVHFLFSFWRRLSRKDQSMLDLFVVCEHEIVRIFLNPLLKYLAFVKVSTTAFVVLSSLFLSVSAGLSCLCVCILQLPKGETEIVCVIAEHSALPYTPFFFFF